MLFVDLLFCINKILGPSPPAKKARYEFKILGLEDTKFFDMAPRVSMVYHLCTGPYPLAPLFVSHFYASPVRSNPVFSSTSGLSAALVMIPYPSSHASVHGVAFIQDFKRNGKFPVCKFPVF